MAEVPAISVLATNVLLTITLERNTEGGDEIHLHAGGQGVWVARMTHSLGQEVTIHAPIGGETGTVVEGLLRAAHLELRAVRTSSPTAAYVHDRRNGNREELAVGHSRPLDRHELDNLYQSFLTGAVGDGMVVVTGRAGRTGPPVSFYKRLGSDLAAAGVRVIGDVHGPELHAFLQGGPIEVLKVSDEDLATDGLPVEGEQAMRWSLRRFHRLGASAVVISRAHEPAYALWGGVLYEISVPRLDTADSRGAGDAMTGALAAAAARGLDPPDALALATAAGAASVTRHGLATVDASLVAQLARRVTVRAIGHEQDGDREADEPSVG